MAVIRRLSNLLNPLIGDRHVNENGDSECDDQDMIEPKAAFNHETVAMRRSDSILIFVFLHLIKLVINNNYSF
jgi:hypothetical protein